MSHEVSYKKREKKKERDTAMLVKQQMSHKQERTRWVVKQTKSRMGEHHLFKRLDVSVGQTDGCRKRQKVPLRVSRVRLGKVKKYLVREKMRA